MTDLVAEAIALVDYEIKQSQSMVNIFANMRLAGILQDGNLNEVAQEKNQYGRFLNSWLTHKAEFEEHKGAHSEVGYVCQKCTKSFSQDKMTIRQYPCDFITTKAKRLLGKE